MKTPDKYADQIQPLLRVESREEVNPASRVLPVSAVIATRNRSGTFARVLESLAQQSAQPANLVVVDASDDEDTAKVCGSPPIGLLCPIIYRQARQRGAAPQRNEAMTIATQPIVWYLDDDIILKPDCVSRLYAALMSDARMGGVNATITNQQYHPPGLLSRLMYHMLDGTRATTWAGRVIGPAVNLLPEDRDGLPEIVPVEWLNSTCTMYRREALPDPPFPEYFTGYSLVEDLALSLIVGRNWKLANARTARIYHDSQSADHKSDPAEFAEMQLVNRHYIMSSILGRRQWRDYMKLLAYETFYVASQVRSPAGRRALVPSVRGRLRAIRRIFAGA